MLVHEASEAECDPLVPNICMISDRHHGLLKAVRDTVD
jgi:hypothetical protein